MNKILIASEKVFDFIMERVENKSTSRYISSFLVTTFIVCLILGYMVKLGWIPARELSKEFSDPFFAIEFAFTLLLLIEIFSLIFVLPNSVARSVGKQFELLSLIFIRSGIKEFSHIKNSFQAESLLTELYGMFSYAFGALLIFAIMGFTYKIQRHIKLTNIEDEQTKFVRSKKLLAIILLAIFVSIGIYDIKNLVHTGSYLKSFNVFYNFLIFSDIIIVLIALRYTMNYYRIFRYSAFVVGTILIRISLSAGMYYNVLIGVSSAFFIFLLTVAYNYFLKELQPELDN